MQSDSEGKSLPQANSSETMEDEDLTSKLIRDEALKTWNLGQQLGIVSSESDRKLMENFMDPIDADVIEAGRALVSNNLVS